MKTLSRLILVCLASCGPLSAQIGVSSSVVHSSDLKRPKGPAESVALKSRQAIESGNRLREKKEFDAALRAYQNAVRFQPENGDAWFYLGMGYVNLHQLEAARSSFRRSVLAAPEDPAKWFGLCLSHYLVGDYSSAVHTCKEAVRLDPQQPDLWAWMGLGYAGQRQWDKAIFSLECATALGTRNSDAWYTLGIRYARQGRRTKVLEVYRQLEELDPEQARKFFHIAVSPKSRG